MAKKETSSSQKRKPATAAKKKALSPKGLVPKRIFIVLLKIFAAGVLLSALFFMVVYLGFTGPVPDTAQLQRIKNPTASEVLAEDGRVLGRYYVENRSNVRFEDISPNLVHALIATEDARFYEHRGIDEVALLRVFFKSILLQQESSGGGSTLSQQIAKNLYPRKNFGPFTMPVNKMREAIIAYRLEKVYSKEDVLELYLNTVPFAENIFGVELACERFFSKKPSEVSVGEAAVIIGMLKANNSYNPRKYPDRAKERRNTVIGQMVKYGYLGEAEGAAHKDEPLKLKYSVINFNQGPAPYFTERLRPQLLEWCENHYKADGTSYNLYTDGLKIKTTINFDMQRYAEQSVAEHMKKLQQIFEQHWENRDPWGNDYSVVERAVKRSDEYRRLKEKGSDDAAIKTEMKKTDSRLLFSWENGPVYKQVSAIDSVRHYLRLLNAGFMAVRPADGSVKAYVGGIDFRFFKYDHVRAQRQVGSTFKPFVYLAALEKGISPDTYFANEKKVYTDYNGWSPSNSHDHYEGYYSMEGALAQSINTIAVDVLVQTGFGKTVELGRALGITAELPEYPTLALGVASVPLEEMVCAYSALVNGGKKISPYYIVSVKDTNGELLEEYENVQEPEPVVDPENCRIIVHMLKSAINEGTGKSIRSVYGIQSDFAGKTGTTQNHADGWFIGMSPGLVAGAWVGGEDPAIHFRTIAYGQGAFMALPIVGGFFQKTFSNPKFSGLKNLYFPEPSEENLALLDIPKYKEVLEIEKKIFDIRKIFKRDQPDEKPKVPEKPVQKEKEPENEKVWQKIKKIFRKKG
jgi:penicillin-binding protein 1A